ncbi:MAG: hypothetical protein MMC33_007643 [Icmadophila ericetorum]|nr:hypothetical protein [Icmadophila ericetorum]
MAKGNSKQLAETQVGGHSHHCKHYSCTKIFGPACIKKGHMIKCPLHPNVEWFVPKDECPDCKRQRQAKEKAEKERKEKERADAAEKAKQAAEEGTNNKRDRKPRWNKEHKRINQLKNGLGI